MMKNTLRKTAAGLFMITMLAILWSPCADAAVRTEHPRVWLDPETKAVLIDRLNSGTPAANALIQWCAANRNSDLSEYTSSRAVSVLESINFALLYQLQGNTDYAERAIEIIEYVFENPYPPYTIDTWIRFDNHYTTRYLVPPVAIVLDWCWDYMSQARRDRFMSQLDTWLRMLVTTEPWAWRDPSNNFYYGYTWAFMASSYAMYGHHDNAEEYLGIGRDVLLEEAIKFTRNERIAWPLWDSWTGRAKGGLWNEGTAYGSVNNEFICSAVLALKSAEGIERPDFTFPSEVLRAMIYSTHPNNRTTYSDGDGAVSGTIESTMRVPLVLCSALSDGDIKEYAKYWLDNYSTRSTWGYKIYHEFMWYDDTAPSTDYHGILPDYYYLEGIQTLFWRSDWSADACWIAMKLGVLNTDHAHNGFGNFFIRRNGTLAANKARLTGNSMLSGDDDHSVFLIPTSGDAKMFWGGSTLEHLENTADYLYFAGDLSDPYLSQPDYRNNVIEHKEREFFLIKDDLALVIMDRGRTSSTGISKTFQVYVPNTPVAAGSDLRVSNGSSDMTVHPAWPADASASAGTNGAPIIRVTSPGDAQDKTFINVVRVADPGNTMTSSRVELNDAGFAAAAFQNDLGTLDYVVVFSNAIDGSTPSFDQFTLTYQYFSLVVRVFVANLTPNTTYYVDDTDSSGALTIAISTTSFGSATSVMSSDEGVLSFLAYPGENPQPVVTPDGVDID